LTDLGLDRTFLNVLSANRPLNCFVLVARIALEFDVLALNNASKGTFATEVDIFILLIPSPGVVEMQTVIAINVELQSAGAAGANFAKSTTRRLAQKWQ
jgi:hypothetical protein